MNEPLDLRPGPVEWEMLDAEGALRLCQQWEETRLDKLDWLRGQPGSRGAVTPTLGAAWEWYLDWKVSGTESALPKPPPWWVAQSRRRAAFTAKQAVGLDCLAHLWEIELRARIPHLARYNAIRRPGFPQPGHEHWPQLAILDDVGRPLATTNTFARIWHWGDQAEGVRGPLPDSGQATRQFDEVCSQLTSALNDLRGHSQDDDAGRFQERLAAGTLVEVLVEHEDAQGCAIQIHLDDELGVLMDAYIDALVQDLSRQPGMKEVHREDRAVVSAEGELDSSTLHAWVTDWWSNQLDAAQNP